MGGVTSKYDTTNWEIANGGITKAKGTIDAGSDPTNKALTAISCIKKQNINDHDFTIVNAEKGDLLYETEVQKGTMRWLNLKNKDGERVFAVQAGTFRFVWEIYSMSPNWYGQQVDEKATASDRRGQPLYRKLQIEFDAWKFHAKVYRYHKDLSENCGVVWKEPILVCQEIWSWGAKFQTLQNENDANLVGYWDWDLKGKHTMNVKLAANSDIALHSLLAVISNLVYIDRNASSAAGASAGAF